MTNLEWLSPSKEMQRINWEEHLPHICNFSSREKQARIQIRTEFQQSIGYSVHSYLFNLNVSAISSRFILNWNWTAVGRWDC